MINFLFIDIISRTFIITLDTAIIVIIIIDTIIHWYFMQSSYEIINIYDIVNNSKSINICIICTCIASLCTYHLPSYFFVLEDLFGFIRILS